MEVEKIKDKIENKTTVETKNIVISARIKRAGSDEWEDKGVISKSSKSKVGLGIVNKIKQKLGIK